MVNCFVSADTCSVSASTCAVSTERTSLFDEACACVKLVTSPSTRLMWPASCLFSACVSETSRPSALHRSTSRSFSSRSAFTARKISSWPIAACRATLKASRSPRRSLAPPPTRSLPSALAVAPE